MGGGIVKNETTFMRTDFLARDIFEPFESLRKEVKVADHQEWAWSRRGVKIEKLLRFGGFRLGLDDASKDVPKGVPVPGFKRTLKPGELMKKLVEARRRGWDGPRVFDYLEEKTSVFSIDDRKHEGSGGKRRRNFHVEELTRGVKNLNLAIMVTEEPNVIAGILDDLMEIE
ncbi:serine/threonine phosphatase 7 [Striga asiatica]|uniref:Serine/threonine phosphatase 7 n=1 Tax=Striga asiatica TaxID=4170 RepID=A0A5A7R081_STRAF|nr:serine/threonine phosphatase 7 [Striga asiatica]